MLKQYQAYDLREILGEHFENLYDRILIRRMNIDLGEAKTVLMSADKLIRFIERASDLNYTFNIKIIYDKIDKFLNERGLDALSTSFCFSKEDEEGVVGYCCKCGNYTFDAIEGENDKLYCSHECFKKGEDHVN
jgi:hypothetical protein